MDSLTQAVLGASIGAALLGRTSGRRAAALGAIVATIPDLDVFIPMGDDVANFTYHRGFSHSFLFCILMTPILVWTASKINWFRVNAKMTRSYIAIFLILVTHILLDAMTIYGTQIFWPLPLPPVGLGSIFIIDPLYTLPFLGCLIWYLFTKSQKVIRAGLVISTTYLCLTVVAQYHVSQIALKSMQDQSIDTDVVLVQCTPFNSILWRVISMNNDQSGYKVGYYSLFDDTKDIEFQDFESQSDLITPIQDRFDVQRLQWFTKGFYMVKHEGDTVVMADIRMGLEPASYIFSFIVNHDDRADRFESDSGEDRSQRLAEIWARLIRDL